MGNKSPLTEIIVDPICKKIFNNLNFSSIKQLCIIFLGSSIYYLINNDTQKSSILYLLYFICFNCLSSSSDNIKINMYYILINLCYIFFMLNSNNFKSNILLVSMLVSILSIISYSITITKEKNESHLKNLLYKISKSIYPINDDTKKYHINYFWKIFDFSFYSLFVFILINVKKNENIYF